jgi:hypothetical protein
MARRKRRKPLELARLRKAEHGFDTGAFHVFDEINRNALDMIG